LVDILINSVEQWKKLHQSDMIDCEKLKCKMTSAACQDRQDKVRHFYKESKNQKETLRPPFVVCKGCDRFTPVRGRFEDTRRELVGTFNAYEGPTENRVTTNVSQYQNPRSVGLVYGRGTGLFVR
jgi:hypothetical protein